MMEQQQRTTLDGQAPEAGTRNVVDSSIRVMLHAVLVGTMTKGAGKLSNAAYSCMQNHMTPRAGRC